MVEKIMLSDKDYEYLTKGIASGVIGIILSFVYSYYRKAKSHKKQSC